MKGNFDLDPVRWATLRDLLQSALELEPGARSTWIDHLGADCEEYKPRLRALLLHAGGSRVAEILETRPRVETAAFAPEPGASPQRAGDRVGPYRLVRELGQGGMGSVWLAERTDMLQRRAVALKLPRLMTGRAALAERMAREREILASLNHPHIARLYDAGVSADGQPFLALEFVEGERFDVHCQRRQLDVPARLRLFLQVARAVAHAHANLVVHRDLKPGNILVTAAGEVRLLDFGIAKLLEDGSAMETELTQLGGRAMTPDYASPEQIQGRPVSTASDVYSLGVVLFELLTGARPYKLKRGTRAALEAAIESAEVQRPSTAATDAKTRKRLRGDLDTIVLKALKKEPAERYGTVEALADDIERHLSLRPVLAQPDSRSYRVGRFLARNRLAVGATASVMLAIVAGAGVALWQAREAQAEQRRAEEVKNFIAALFRDANPYLGGGAKMTVDELLVKAKPRIDTEFANRPAIRAELLVIIGTSLASLGEERTAEPLLEEAAAASERELGRLHVLTLNARSLLLGLRRQRDRSGAVALELDRLIADMRRSREVTPDYFANTLSQRAHAALHLGEPETAVKFAEEALRVSSERIGPQAEQTLGNATLLAFAHQRAGQGEQALAAAQHVMQLVFEVRRLPETHPSAVDARIMHGIALGDMGRLPEALAEMARGLDNALQIRKASEPTIGAYRGHLARVQMRAGHLTEAVENYRTAMAIFRAAAPGTRLLAASALNLGVALIAARQPQEALEHLESAHRYFVGSASSEARTTRVQLGVALAMMGRDAAARNVTEGAASTADDAETLAGLGIIERHAGHHAQALALQERALAKLVDSPPRQRERARLLAEIAHSHFGLERYEDSARLFEQAVGLLAPLHGPSDPEHADTLMGLGRARLAAGNAAQALALLRQADSFWREFDAANRWAGEAAFWLGRCHAALGDAEEARKVDARARQALSRSPLPADAELLRRARIG